jgi:hypothetical protein
MATVAQGEIDYSIFSAKRYSRLRIFFGKHSKARALTACQNHCNTMFFSHFNSHPPMDLIDD